MDQEYDPCDLLAEPFDPQTTYDAIILGSGLKECLLTGMLQISGKKVLHLNRWKKAVPFWKQWKLPSPEPHIQSAPLDRRERDGKVDLNPKLLIVNSQIVRLIDPDDRRNLFPRSLHFESFEGSYEYEGGQIHKVYPYDKDNLIDSLGDFYRSENYRWIESVVDDERRDFEDFLKYIQEWQEDDPNTWNDIDPDSTTMYQVYGYFDLNPGFADYTGRALALYRDDTYLNRPARETFRRIKIYSKSLACYDEPGSLWLFMASTDYEGYRSVFEGVEEDRQSFLPGAASEFRVFEDIPHLVQGFAGLTKFRGASPETFEEIIRFANRMSRPGDEIMMENGKVVGVRSGEEIVRCKQVYCDPSYVPDRVEKFDRVIRCVCLLKGNRYPRIEDPSKRSKRLIIPGREFNRHSVRYTNVSPYDSVIAMISTNVETDEPEQEISPVFKLLGDIQERIVTVSDCHWPREDGTETQLFISQSYDVTTNFETTLLDVLDIFRRGTGEDFDWNRVRFLKEGQPRHFEESDFVETIFLDEFDEEASWTTMEIVKK